MEASKKINLFVLTSSHAVNAFYTQLLIPVLPLIVREFDLNYVQAGLIVTTYALANSVFQFPFSFLADYTGRWRTVLALSLFTQALPVLLYGFAADYSLLLLFVFISGIGSSAYHPPAVALFTRELPDRLGFSMGLFNGGGAAGNMIAPALVGWLAVYLASWRVAAQLFVIPGLIWAGIIWLRFHDVSIERLPLRQAARTTFRTLIHNRALMLLVLLSSIRITGFRGLMAFLPLLLAEEFGFDTKGVGWILSGFFVLGTSSTLMIGRWSDGRSRTRIIMVMTVTVAAFLAAIPWTSSVPALLAILAMVGCFLTPVPSLVLAVGTEVVDERLRTSSVGLIYGMNEAASAFSPLIGGLVAETTGLRLSFLFYAFLFGAAVLVALMLHRERERMKLVPSENPA